MSEPTFQLEKIGPAEAEELLKMNLKNRNIVDRAVAEYAAAMANKEWQFDGAPIRISDNGVVLDGQHRLSAIVKSGTTHDFLVIRGIKREAQAIMDTGRKRTLANALTLRGEKDSTALGALLTLAFRWHHGVRGTRMFTGGGGGLSIANAAVMTPQTPTMLRFLDESPTIKDAIKPGNQLNRHLPIPPRVGSLAYLVLNQIDPEDAKYFFEKLASGAGLDEDNPILVLRNRLQEMGRDSTRGQVTAPEIVLAFMFKAWNSWRDGQSIKRLKYTQGGANPDKFPEPK